MFRQGAEALLIAVYLAVLATFLPLPKMTSLATYSSRITI